MHRQTAVMFLYVFFFFFFTFFSPKCLEFQEKYWFMWSIVNHPAFTPNRNNQHQQYYPPNPLCCLPNSLSFVLHFSFIRRSHFGIFGFKCTCVTVWFSMEWKKNPMSQSATTLDPDAKWLLVRRLKPEVYFLGHIGNLTTKGDDSFFQSSMETERSGRHNVWKFRHNAPTITIIISQWFNVAEVK